MNLGKLITISTAATIALSATMSLHEVQTWIWRAQAKLIYDSRSETWGSPRFFPDRHFVSEKANKGSAKPTHKAPCNRRTFPESLSPSPKLI